MTAPGTVARRREWRAYCEAAALGHEIDRREDRAREDEPGAGAALLGGAIAGLVGVAAFVIALLAAAGAP